VPQIDVKLGKSANDAFRMSISILPGVSEKIVHDSIVPVTSRVISPFGPVAIGNDPESITKLSVLVKSAVVTNATPENLLPAHGADEKTI